MRIWWDNHCKLRGKSWNRMKYIWCYMLMFFFVKLDMMWWFFQGILMGKPPILKIPWVDLTQRWKTHSSRLCLCILGKLQEQWTHQEKTWTATPTTPKHDAIIILRETNKSAGIWTYTYAWQNMIRYAASPFCRLDLQSRSWLKAIIWLVAFPSLLLQFVSPLVWNRRWSLVSTPLKHCRSNFQGMNQNTNLK